jgi:hypothetical protein
MVLSRVRGFWETDKLNKYFCLLAALTPLSVALHPLWAPHFSLYITVLELIFCLIILVAFGVIATHVNARHNSFYERNKFYCLLMLTTALLITSFSVHFLSLPDVHRATKVWEVAAYMVTTIYNLWFWFGTSNGHRIQDEIQAVSRGNHQKVRTTVLLSFITLVLITVIHTIAIFGGMFIVDWLWKPLATFSILITLSLIIFVYVLFVKLGKLVIDNCSTQKFKRDFIIGLKYIDRPTLIIFCILFMYAVYTTAFSQFQHMESMEIFFSGAIAFELLLSSIVWANTETV